MTKISTPILGETTIEKLLPKIKQLGENLDVVWVEESLIDLLNK